MTDDDRKAVLVRLTQLAEVFNRTLTREVWLAYVKALDDLPGPTVLRALDRCLQTCKRFPSPADVREQTRPGDRTGPPQRALPALTAPRVTRSSMAAILRDVAPRCAPGLRRGFVAMAEAMAAGRPLPADDSPMGRIVAAVEREPGADDDDPTPSRWWDA